MTQQFHLWGIYPRQLKAIALFTRTKSRNKSSVHQLMNKPSVMYIYIYICTHTEYYSVIKKWNYATYQNVDGPWKHYAKWNKPDTKGHIVYDSSYTEVPRIGKFVEAESRIEVARGWGQGERGVTVQWIQSLCWGWWQSLEYRACGWLHNLVNIFNAMNHTITNG